MRKLLALILLTATVSSHAETNLVMRCDSAVAPTQAAACTGARSWVHPLPGDAVLSYPTAATDSNAVSWSDAALQFRPWISIPGSFGVLTCTKDIAAGAIPAGGADPCAPGADAVAKVFVSASAVITATVPPPVPTANTGKAVTLDWPPRTLNEDGSPLTDLAGFNVYQGATAATLAKIAGPLPASALTYKITGLAPGTYVFAVTAFNSAGIESDFDPVSYTRAQTKPGKVSVTVTVSVP